MEFSWPRDQTHISCLADGSHLESPLFHQLRVLVAIGIEFNEKFFDISDIHIQLIFLLQSINIVNYINRVPDIEPLLQP